MPVPVPVPLPRQSLSGAIGSAAAVLLYLDYDGTLVPIRSDPSQCRLPDSLAGVLQRLAERQAAPVFDLAVISGRSLDDLRRQLGAVATHLSLAGNHGLEIASGGQIWRHPEAEARRPELDAVAELLGEHFSRWPLAWLEHKGLSLSLHSRALAPDQRQALAQQLLPVLDQIQADGLFRLRRGRMVLEIRPAIDHTKTHAVQLIERSAAARGHWPAPSGSEPLRLYCGDDNTDEDVFSNWPGVIGVRVGPGWQGSSAPYRLSGPAGVAQWLRLLDRI